MRGRRRGGQARHTHTQSAGQCSSTLRDSEGRKEREREKQSQAHLERYTDPQPESDGNTHTRTCGETGGTPARARRKDREVGGDEKTEVRPGA